MHQMQKMMDTISKSAEEDRSRYHLTIGELIKVLEDSTPDTLVKFDKGGSPTSPHSYRGYYSDLAFETQKKPIRATVLLGILKDSVLDKTFEGYKGGDYVMSADKPIWKAEYGDCGPAVLDIRRENNALVLITKEMEY